MNSFTRKNIEKYSNILVLLAILSYVAFFACIFIFPYASNWVVFIPGILGAIFAITAKLLFNIAYENKKSYDL